MDDEPDTSRPPSPPAMSPPGDFTPAQVRRILQRASEIDAHGEHASVEELLRVAREAGIDRRAMERAIAEVAAGDAPTLPAPSTPLMLASPDRDTLVPSILTGAGVGLVAGVFTGVVVSSPVGVAGIAALFVFALVRAAQLGRKGALLEFEIQNLVTMGLAFAGMIAFQGPLAEELSAVVMLLWVVTSVIGGGLVWWLGRDAPDSDPGA